MDRYTDIYGHPADANVATSLLHAADVKAAFLSTSIFALSNTVWPRDAASPSPFSPYALPSLAFAASGWLLEAGIVNFAYGNLTPVDDGPLPDAPHSDARKARALHKDPGPAKAISQKTVDRMPGATAAFNSKLKYSIPASFARHMTAYAATLLAMVPVYYACLGRDEKAVACAMLIAAPVLRLLAASNRHDHIAKGDWAIVDTQDDEVRQTTAKPVGLPHPDPATA